ncbi:hypothetical protein RJ640_013134 [Escallonia rubra]|nr:hypothetical protein RJ640_013134 [Escallonia rubra]
MPRTSRPPLKIRIKRRIPNLDMELEGSRKDGAITGDKGAVAETMAEATSMAQVITLKMPRSTKSSLLEADSLSSLDGLERRFKTYDLRFGSLDATLGDLQKNYSDMKLEMLSTVTQINSRLEALLKAKPQAKLALAKNPNHNSSMPKTPKLTFPWFNGDNPRGWVKRCEQYFKFCPIHEEYKVAYASIHFEDQVEYWYSTYIKPLGKVTWTQFVQDLYARFFNIGRDSVIGDFNQLRQTASVNEYYNYFEELRAQLVEEFGSLDEGYFIKSFIGGLKPEIRSHVEQFEVGTLTKAIHISRKEEVAISNLFPQPKIHHTSGQNHPKPISPYYTKSAAQPISTPSTLPKPPLHHPFLGHTSKGILPLPPNPPTKTSLPIRHLTHEEHQHKREQ